MGSDPILSQACPLVKETRDWLGYLKEEDDEVMINEARSSTRIGRPCGDDSFMSRIEGLIGWKLKALARMGGRVRIDKWSLFLLILSILNARQNREFIGSILNGF